MATKVELTPAELFAACDFTSKESIVGLFPVYAQEQYALKAANKKNVSKAVNIENFTLKTPYEDQTLLKQTELILEANRRQCLYGSNGTGKTLLFENMAGAPGKRIKDFPKHLHVHHCKELENHELSDTVLGTVVNCYPFRNILVATEKRLKELLAAEPAPADDVKAKLQENLDWIAFQINTIRGHDAEDRASKMLRVLGFDEVGQKKLCSALSGGLRMRVALCMAFFIEADLLLLDEPTNHLDFPSVLWLENRLRGYKGSFLLVTHDRELLNNVTTSVLLLEDQKIKYYACGFSDFERKKAADDKKKFDEIEKFLMKHQNPDPSTMLGKQRQEKKDWSTTYYQKLIAMQGKFTFPTATDLDNPEKLAPENISLINLKDVRFSYDVSTNHFIFNDPISFNVTASTRVGVMGPNGAGKSTLLKLLTQKLIPTNGTVTHHPNFQLAYFGQHSTAELDLEMTANEWMQQQFPGESAGALKNHLNKTGVIGNSADTRMKSLAYSQRSCIIFAKLTYVCPHLLILDEPTNFLDLESVDSLISACNKYKGALLLVSHNRDFLRKCAKQFLSVVPGQFLMFNDLKTAERSTYTFIAEMEEGGKVGASALANNPGGGSIHSSQKVGAAKDEEKKAETELINGVKAFTISASTSSAPPKPKAETFAANEKVEALWTDGKWYQALVKKVIPGAAPKYSVTYTEYGNTATVPAASLRKPQPAPPKGAKGAPVKGPNNKNKAGA